MKNHSTHPRVLGAAVALGAAAVATQAQADIIYVNLTGSPITIPDNIDGIYMNIVTGTFGTTGGAVSGWDINPYSAAAGLFNLWGPTTNTWFSTSGVIGGPYNLTLGTTISGAATAFFRPGGATDIGPSINFNSSNNYFGFRFTNESTGQVNFGWIQLAFGATTSDRSIVAYGYENTGLAIGAGAVPEPSTMAALGALALGALGLRQWRRQKAA